MSHYPQQNLRTQPSDATRVAVAVILVSTIARLILAAGLDYGIDEAYAVSVGRQFQWSFFDHPPIAFWTAGAMETLFGFDAPHWLIRLPFVLAFSGTSWLIFALGRRLLGEMAGLWGLIFLTLSPFFFASAGSWIVPDGPVDLFLAASALVLADILFNEHDPRTTARRWLLMGVLFGFACLSKYHAFLFAAGAVVFMIATRHRAQLTRPAPWIAGIIALAIFSPVIWWNAGHGWISIAFQTGRSHVEGGLYPVHVVQMLAGEAAYLLPWTLVLLISALVRGLATKPKWLDQPGSQEKVWFLASLSLPATILFTVLPLFGSRGLPHWPMPGWLFAFPILGAMVAQVVANGSRWPIWFARGSAALLALVAVAVIGLTQSGSVAGWLLRTPGMVDGAGIITPLLNEASDWKGLNAALTERGLGANAGRFIATPRWFEAARISSALASEGVKPLPVVTVFNEDARGFAFLTDQTTLLGEDAVIITEPQFALDPVRMLAPYFQRIDEPELITISVAGGIPKTLQVAPAHALVKPYPLRYGATPR